jgi:hypothetical protein
LTKQFQSLYIKQKKEEKIGLTLPTSEGFTIKLLELRQCGINERTDTKCSQLNFDKSKNKGNSKKSTDLHRKKKKKKGLIHTSHIFHKVTQIVSDN